MYYSHMSRLEKGVFYLKVRYLSARQLTKAIGLIKSCGLMTNIASLDHLGYGNIIAAVQENYKKSVNFTNSILV